MQTSLADNSLMNMSSSASLCSFCAKSDG